MLIFNFRSVKIKIEVANEKAAVRDDLAGSIWPLAPEKGLEKSMYE